MKGIFSALFFTALLFAGFTTHAANPTYTLAEALKKNLVSAEIQGSDTTLPGGSSHYGKCIKMQLTNLTNQKFTVKLEAGQQLLPDDSAIQTMMVTETMLFAFNTVKKQKKYINAMCIQKSDGGPGKRIKFAMGGMSIGHLLGIAQLVEKHKYFDRTGQAAVWCISDGASITDIDDPDTVKTKILQEFVAKATGQKIPTRNARRDEYKTPERRYKTTVVFEWTTHGEANTTLAVLDKNNQPVMEIIKAEMLPGGTYSRTIELSSATLPLGEYTVILYLNKRPFMQRRIILGP